MRGGKNICEVNERKYYNNNYKMECKPGNRVRWCSNKTNTRDYRMLPKDLIKHRNCCHAFYEQLLVENTI